MIKVNWSSLKVGDKIILRETRSGDNRLRKITILNVIKKGRKYLTLVDDKGQNHELCIENNEPKMNAWNRIGTGCTEMFSEDRIALLTSEINRGQLHEQLNTRLSKILPAKAIAEFSSMPLLTVDEYSQAEKAFNHFIEAFKSYCPSIS